MSERAAGSPDAAALVRASDAELERGDPARALVLVERALSVDIDAPGARERHGRLCALLGLGPSVRRDPTATLPTGARPDAPFRLVREAGRGSAGVVYEAFDDALGRPVALKMYHRPAADRARLVGEARAAAALAGPGVVRVFDANSEAGWIAMEWAAGGALSTRLRETSLADASSPSVANQASGVSDASAWVEGVAAALGRIHRAGVVHGDVKPENILFSAADRVLLTDFGLSRAPGEAYAGGTRGYVSPERAAGAPAHPDDDVFALGKTLERWLAAPASSRDPRRSRLERAVARAVDVRGARPADAAALLNELGSPDP